MSSEKVRETDWKSMNHVVPKEFEKYVVMLAEACSADNELKRLTRFQKVVRAIIDDKDAAVQELVEALEFYKEAHSYFDQGATFFEVDKGERARQALAKFRGEP